MAYLKMITYGRNVELYEYEKNVNTDRRPRRSFTRRSVLQVLADDRATSIQSGLNTETTSGKRKDSARRASMAFRRIVLANLGGLIKPIFLTLTYRENEGNLKERYSDFTDFCKALRYRYGSVFSYVAVPEFQVRGAVHFHMLVWGLQIKQIGQKRRFPKNTIDCDFWSYGFIFAKETDGHERIASYLAKYMSKAFLDSRLYGLKAYVASRNCKRPVVYSGGVVGAVLDDWVGDVSPYKVKSYDTTFLGQCKKSFFDIDIVGVSVSEFNLSTEITENDFALW